MIVPANYDPSEAANFAASVNTAVADASAIGGFGLAAGVGAAKMTEGFLPGGEQDLQRGDRWKIPRGETAPAFRDAASWNLGYVTQMTNLPNASAVIGGGVLNSAEYGLAEAKMALGFGPGPTQKLDGPMGMSESNYKDFLAGVASAKQTQMATKHGLDGKTALEKLRHYAAQAHAKAASKLVSSHMQFHHTVMKMIRAQPSYAPVRNRQSGGQATPGTHAEAGSWSAPQLAQTSMQRLIASLLQRSSLTLGAASLTRIARQASASAGLSPGFYERIKNNRTLRGAKTSAADKIAALSPLRPALPSFAPRGATTSRYPGLSGHTQTELSPSFRSPSPSQTSASWALSRRQAQSAANAAQAENDAVASTTSQQHLKQSLNEYFDQQARLPPSGATAFDPRLTPAWSGLKLPA